MNPKCKVNVETAPLKIYYCQYVNFILVIQVTATNITSQDALVSRLAKLTVQGNRWW